MSSIVASIMVIPLLHYAQEASWSGLSLTTSLLTLLAHLTLAVLVGISVPQLETLASDSPVGSMSHSS